MVQKDVSTVHFEKCAKLVLHKSPKLTANSNPEVEIIVTAKHLYVKLLKNETDIQFLKSFSCAKWDNANYQWIVTNYNRNLSLLQSYFGERRLLKISSQTIKRRKHTLTL